MYVRREWAAADGEHRLEQFGVGNNGKPVLQSLIEHFSYYNLRPKYRGRWQADRV